MTLSGTCFTLKKHFFVIIGRWTEPMAIRPNLLYGVVRLGFHVSKERFREQDFVDKNIYFHHFRQLSYNFSGSLLKLFQWVCQNCLLHVENNLGNKILSKKKCFHHFRTLRPIFRPFVEKIWAVFATVDCTCPGNDLEEYRSGEPKKGGLQQRAVDN